MGRSKKARTYSYKPFYKEFIPLSEKTNGIIRIDHDELEAIYLMDYLGKYQEDAAKQMEISRPTFSRIIKEARFKISKAIVCGLKMVIEDDIENYKIAFCIDEMENFSTISTKNKYITILDIQDSKIKEISTLNNPLYNTNAKPAVVFPNLLQELQINIFISNKIGQGLKNSLLNLGITPLEIDVDKVSSYEDLFKFLKS